MIRKCSGLLWTLWWTFDFQKAQKLPECRLIEDCLPSLSYCCTSTVSDMGYPYRHKLIWIGRDLKGNGRILFRGKITTSLKGLRKTMTTVNMVGSLREIELMTLRCKWEVLVLVSSCYIRLGTACYCEVWRTVLWDGTEIPTVQIQYAT